MKDGKPTIKYLRDSLVNIVSNLGLKRDKGSHSAFARTLLLSRPELEALYAESWIAGKIIDVMSNEMTRTWRTVSSPKLSPDKLKEFEEEEKRLKVKTKFNEAIKWARLYGQSAIVPVFEGTSAPLHEPLELSEVKEGSLKFLNVVDGHDLMPSTHVTFNAFDEDYLQPTFFTVAGTSARIHHSRIIRLTGRKVPRQIAREYRFGGQPVLEVVYKALINAETSSDSIASLLHEMNLDIMSVKGLAESLASGQEDVIKDRYETYSYLKSIFNLVVVDADGEQFQNRQLSFANMDKIAEFYYDVVAGATGIPPSRMVKRSSRGLGNENSEEERKIFYEEVSGRQEEMLETPLQRMDELMALSLWGEVPEDFTSEFNDLHSMDETQQAAVDLSNAQRDQIYVGLSIVPEYTVAAELQQKGTYDNLDDDYIKELEVAVKENDLDLSNEPNESNEDDSDGTEPDTPEPEVQEPEA